MVFRNELRLYYEYFQECNLKIFWGFYLEGDFIQNFKISLRLNLKHMITIFQNFLKLILVLKQDRYNDQRAMYINFVSIIPPLKNLLIYTAHGWKVLLKMFKVYIFSL